MSPASIPTQPRFDATYLDNPKPPYPGISRRLGEQGRVVLRIHVTADGLPQIVQIHTSSGYTRLDDSALETVRRWKFVAAKLGNEPVAATVLVPIIFSLKG
ncbi:energy transducer TonB [Rugosibacter aromaticivorans]|uniref:energy transducer TonB n=1 Tax=Rugosibacter aromaticivorans TaxID=1565605 RepID=UPI00192A4BB8|nr:energy transducer TonB [Rugosibacter aromaticivorans]